MRSLLHLALVSAVMSQAGVVWARDAGLTSTPFDAGAEGMTVWIAPVPGDEDVDAAGQVLSVSSPRKGVRRVKVQGTKGAFVFELALPPRIKPPLAKGDTIRVQLRKVGWHGLFEAGVWTSDGRTLIAIHVGAPNPPEVRELQVSQGGPVGETVDSQQRIVQRAVTFSAPDATASTSNGAWRRLQTDGQVFFVWGASKQTSSTGPQVPDSVPNTFDWAIVRSVENTKAGPKKAAGP